MSDDDETGPDRDDDEADWVEIRRFADPIRTDMICDFLRDHDVRVQVRGNTAATRLPWSETSNVIRIVVHPADVAKARDALVAMEAGEAVDQPFRGPGPKKKGDDEEEAYVQKRSALGAAFLGLLVPIGAGHFYARHGAAGTILCAGIVGCVLGMWFGGHWELSRAWAILVVVDMVAARWAVKRFNEGRVPPEGTQRAWAAAAVLVAFGIAWFTASP